MDTSRYQARVDATLAKVERWLEDFDPDELDYSKADGVITMEFADRSRYVLNRQSAASQLWLAAGARAWHYNFDEARDAWLDDRDGHELLANLSRAVSTKLGREVAL